MSNVHRLRLTDGIFFVNVNLRPKIRQWGEGVSRLRKAHGQKITVRGYEFKFDCGIVDENC